MELSGQELVTLGLCILIAAPIAITVIGVTAMHFLCKLLLSPETEEKE